MHQLDGGVVFLYDVRCVGWTSTGDVCALCRSPVGHIGGMLVWAGDRICVLVCHCIAVPIGTGVVVRLVLGCVGGW